MKSRLAILNLRYEKLVELNRKNDYVTMVHTENGLISNPKQEKYFRLLKSIYEEKVGLYLFNRKNNEIYAKSLETAKNAVIGLTKQDIFNLTKPN